MSTSPLPARTRWSASTLAALVNDLAADSRSWIGRVRFRAGERWYERLERSDEHEVWAISWLPGQATGFHDHGGASGAFAVAFGTLEEHRPDREPHPVTPGEVRTFDAHDVHDVRNTSSAPAVSIHAYAPPLSVMHRYEFGDEGLEPRGALFEDEERREPEGRSIDDLLSDVRQRLRRFSAEEAYAAACAGALLVDIRPARQRAEEGEIPGAVVIERNVLEWRLDPASDARLPVATGYDRTIVVVCSAGYASSLAAASLRDLGLFRATDLIGGFQAWRAAGLPITVTMTDKPSSSVTPTIGRAAGVRRR